MRDSGNLEGIGDWEFSIGGRLLILEGLAAAAAEPLGMGGGRIDPAGNALVYGSGAGVWVTGAVTLRALAWRGIAILGRILVVKVLVVFVDSLDGLLNAGLGCGNTVVDEFGCFDEDLLERPSLPIVAFGFVGALKTPLWFSGVCAEICAGEAMTWLCESGSNGCLS